MPPSTITKTKKIMSLLGLSVEDLPVECILDILSRLPVKTIIHCRCVCKKWLDLISDTYFANLHLSRLPAIILMIHHYSGKQIPGILKWVEVEDEIDHHSLHHDPVMSLDFNLAPIFQNSLIYPVGSVDGLICFRHFNTDVPFICNPVTREYMILPKPHVQYDREFSAKNICCFGVGSLTQEYKVIWISQRWSRDSPSTSRSLLEAEVYTLGTGQWRCLCHIPYSLNKLYGTFLNGHAHWNVIDKHSPEKLYAFDFDKESFELFPSPPSEEATEDRLEESLGVLKGCLCRCDTYSSKFTVWVMKEYGIKNSWHKELVIERSISPNLNLLLLKHVSLIEGLKDGTILMSSVIHSLFVYCPRRKTSVATEIFSDYFGGFVHHPSFHRLQNLENERVQMF